MYISTNTLIHLVSNPPPFCIKCLLVPYAAQNLTLSHFSFPLCEKENGCQSKEHIEDLVPCYLKGFLTSIRGEKQATDCLFSFKSTEIFELGNFFVW